MDAMIKTDRQGGLKQVVSESNQLFPFLSYSNKLLKEFFFESKLINDTNGELFLVLNLKVDNDLTAYKFIVDTSNMNVTYYNSRKI